ncbi:MAG: DUF4214 domain-containing protein [Methylococcus sp.]|nr:DUF4214 domain-containing protein [Methylococcus sp.]
MSSNIRLDLRVIAASVLMWWLAYPNAVSAAVMSAQVRLTTIPGYARSPQITSFGSNLYIVWAENIAPDRYDIYVIRSPNNGDSWASPVRLATNIATFKPLPQIGAGQNGVYVFWTDNILQGSSGQGIYYSRSTDGGMSFSAPTLLIGKSSNGYTRPSSVLVDASNGTDRVYLAWYDSRASGGLEVGQVFLAVSCDGGATFTSPQHVTVHDRGNDAESPSLALDSSGTLFLLYRSSLNGIPQEGWPPFSQHLMRSSLIACGSDPAVQWLHPSQLVSKALPEEFGNTYGGLLASGGSGRLHTAYWSDGSGNNLIYRAGLPYSLGWSAPIDVTSDVSGYGLNYPENSNDSAFGFGESASGDIHISMWQQRGTTAGGLPIGRIYYRKGTAVANVYSFGAPEAVVNIDTSFEPSARINNDRLGVVWSDVRDDVSAGSSELYFRNVFTQQVTGSAISVSATALDFGRQLITTAGLPKSVSITSIGDNATIISGVSTTGPFSATTDCGIQVSGTTCSVNVSFSPSAIGDAVGTLTIASNAVNAPHTVSLYGVGIGSLVEHYYRSILDRAPDAAGQAFWEGEVQRLGRLGVDPREVFIVMANYFFNSAEYIGRGTSNATFIGNLYRTFFARSPDAGGLSYWSSQLAAGMPRDIEMYNFLFSPEFNGFMSNFFGNTPSRAEVLAVVDYYRGILGRLPDTGGLNYWVGRFRQAQCQGAGPVYAEAESISQGFFSSQEYSSRGRNNTQYVSDLYNAFLRRGGDLEGVSFWINQLNAGTKSRDQERRDFIATPEFTNRINAIVTQGCL